MLFKSHYLHCNDCTWINRPIDRLFVVFDFKQLVRYFDENSYGSTHGAGSVDDALCSLHDCSDVTVERVKLETKKM